MINNRQYSNLSKITAICVSKYCSQPLNTNILYYGRTVTDFERRSVFSIHICPYLRAQSLQLAWMVKYVRKTHYLWTKMICRSYRNFYRRKALATCCWGSASFLPWETTARSLRSEGQQSIFYKDQEHMLVSSILKLSACWFRINSHYVSKVSFTSAQ